MGKNDWYCKLEHLEAVSSCTVTLGHAVASVASLAVFTHEMDSMLV